MEKTSFCHRSSLTILFAVCMSVFLQMPAGLCAASSDQPGMDFIPHSEEYSGSTLIWFNISSYRTYTERLDKELDVYRVPKKNPNNIFHCDDHYYPPKGGICDVDIKQFGPCNGENYYGYFKMAPCVFLKLNNIPGWIPHFYNDSSKLPYMPSFLKEHIKQVETANPARLNTIWVTCEGESPADVEYIGPVSYYPMPGFAGYYFPMVNSAEYLSPLVAVQFKRPTLGVVIFVECKMWSRYIVQDREKLLGVTRFQLLLD